MTKLEEKLIELVYELYYARRPDIWEKDFNENIIIMIYTTNGVEGWVSVSQLASFRTQQYIDNLQQAFNEMQKDLAILKECEN